jgi:AraC-like DNA-binding protein
MHLSTEVETINEADRRHLAKAERMLIDSLTTKFMGIGVLTEAAHMSPTKLKTLFKKEYGKSLLQYYQEKQMELALKLLKKEGASVKQVSLSLGYDNPSYFTATFKKHHNILPSDVTKDV